MQAQLQNQAGAALVIHIKWLRALFFAMAKVVESKGDTLNTIVNKHITGTRSKIDGHLVE